MSGRTQTKVRDLSTAVPGSITRAGARSMRLVTESKACIPTLIEISASAALLASITTTLYCFYATISLASCSFLSSSPLGTPLAALPL